MVLLIVLVYEAAAIAIAHILKDDELHEDYIIPGGFDRKVVAAVSHAVAEAARRTGLVCNSSTSLLPMIKSILPSPLDTP